MVGGRPIRMLRPSPRRPVSQQDIYAIMSDGGASDAGPSEATAAARKAAAARVAARAKERAAVAQQELPHACVVHTLHTMPVPQRCNGLRCQPGCVQTRPPQFETL